jgi:hypothetical protein
MLQSDRSGGRPVWHSPEIVDVGGVLETTTGNGGNVRDNVGNDPPMYTDVVQASAKEVDLGGR